MIKIPTIKETKDQLITIALNKVNGNRTKAARLLGMSYNWLIRNIKRRVEVENE